MWSMFKMFYLGLNVAMFAWWPFMVGESWIEDKRYTVSQLVVNLVFPLTLLDYLLVYVVEKGCKLASRIAWDRTIFRK